MALSTANYLKSLADSIQASGQKAISSDFTFEIEGFEQNYLLIKQFPWPAFSSAGEIEVAAPMGMALWQPQQGKVNLQGSVTLQETVAGAIDSMLIGLIARGGIFNAKIYHGTPTHYISYKPIYDAFFQIDNADTDFENRSQVLVFSGTLFFHYFGEIVAGNVNSLNGNLS